jgi:endonuclease-3
MSKPPRNASPLSGADPSPSRWGRADRARWLLDELPRLYPEAHCELVFHTPWELLVATILSAQCTDKRVNGVTPALFARFPGPGDLAEAAQEAVEELIRSTGFFRNKARNLRLCAQKVIQEHGGELPPDLKALAELPGVGRKTANVVLGNAFGINAGMVVDTHIGRLSRRLGLTRHTDPVKVERDLMRHFPRDSWKDLSHWLISHGRAVCQSRKPACELCSLAPHCPSAGKARP